jgi:hypothetical protein
VGTKDWFHLNECPGSRVAKLDVPEGTKSAKDLFPYSADFHFKIEA